MSFFKAAASVAALSLAAGSAMADPTGCDEGEIVVKFSHVTNTDRHPKGIAATLLQERVNAEMEGIMCMEVFPNSTLYNDDQVLEAMLQGDVQMAAPRVAGSGILAQRHEAVFGQRAADHANRRSGPKVPRAAVRCAGGPDGSAGCIATADGVLRSLRRLADRRCGRAGKHMVQRLWPEVL